MRHTFDHCQGSIAETTAQQLDKVYSETYEEPLVNIWKEQSGQREWLSKIKKIMNYLYIIIHVHLLICLFLNL